MHQKPSGDEVERLQVPKRVEEKTRSSVEQMIHRHFLAPFEQLSERDLHELVEKLLHLRTQYRCRATERTCL
jgi:hypothetical protein